MKREGRKWKTGFCKQCGEPFKKKPADKEFCKDRWRYRFNARKRVVLVESQMMTVGQAACSMGKSYEQVRGMIRRGEVRARRFFGRILVYRADVDAKGRHLT